MPAQTFDLLDVDDDPVLAALDQLVLALRDNASRIQASLERAERMRDERLGGRSYRDIETSGDGPLILAMTRDNMSALAEAGSRLRRAEARALYDEGMTMEQVADLFGVTRQRVSALLRED
jgi:hypothetical protein